MIEQGQLVLLVSPKGKRYLRRIDFEQPLHTNDGKLEMSDVAQAGFGSVIKTHLGKAYKIFKPTLYDLCKNVKRQTQIIYPKDIGYIIMRLGVGPGMTVVEAGSGSGSLTTALAWFVGPTGKVYTHERRPEFTKLCQRNLSWAGVDDGRVEHLDRDIGEEGFADVQADALFLDVRTPWEYLDKAVKAVKPGAPFAFLLPTMNQVSQLLAALQDGPFDDLEVVEILLRRYKTVPDRMRPDDRMVAHTGFLVFARHVEPVVPEAKIGEEAPVEAACEPIDDTPVEEPFEAPSESGDEPVDDGA